MSCFYNQVHIYHLSKLLLHWKEAHSFHYKVLFLLLKKYIHTFYFHRGHGYLKKERKKKKRKLEHKCSWVQLSSKKREEKDSHAPCKEKRRRDKEKRHHPPSYPLTYLGLWLHDMTLLGSIAWLSKISRTNMPSFDPYL